MSSEDVYGDLGGTDLGESILKLERTNQTLQGHIEKLEADIGKLCAELTEMKRVQQNLTRNISELFKTAKAEITRKDRMIADLRSEIDGLIFRRQSKRCNQDQPPHETELEAKRQKHEGFKEETEHNKPEAPTASRSTSWCRLGGDGKSHGESPSGLDPQRRSSHSFRYMDEREEVYDRRAKSNSDDGKSHGEGPSGFDPQRRNPRSSRYIDERQEGYDRRAKLDPLQVPGRRHDDYKYATRRRSPRPPNHRHHGRNYGDHRFDRSDRSRSRSAKIKEPTTPKTSDVKDETPPGDNNVGAQDDVVDLTVSSSQSLESVPKVHETLDKICVGGSVTVSATLSANDSVVGNNDSVLGIKPARRRRCVVQIVD